MPTTAPAVCKKNGHGHCCVNHRKENGKCVPCPAGSFGIDCALSCPLNYYGVLCKKLCNCKIDQLCLKDKGCARSIGLFNETLSNTDVRRTDNTALIVILCVSILLIIAVALVLRVMKRTQTCADKFKLFPQACAEQGDSEDSVNIPQHRSIALPRIDEIVSTNQNCRHQCTLAIEESAYEDIDNGVSNDYNLLELRLRNVSCVSTDLDRLETNDEYVSLRHEGSKKNTDMEEIS